LAGFECDVIGVTAVGGECFGELALEIALDNRRIAQWSWINVLIEKCPRAHRLTRQRDPLAVSLQRRPIHAAAAAGKATSEHWFFGCGL